jgi:hypothetical protein
MIVKRAADERGMTRMPWLDSRHTFSFGEYHDPAHMGFGPLRVINEDRVVPGGGFATHGHRDMEIVSYVLSGALEHKDSLGTGSIIRPGDVQRMSAGTGIRHSEFNPSRSEPVHFLQIWILPERAGLTPSYEQKAFPAEERRGGPLLVASPDGSDGAVTIHQDARIYVAELGGGDAIEQPLSADRRAWIQVARGEIELSGVALGPGDGAAVEDERRLHLRAGSGPAEVLLFDLA